VSHEGRSTQVVFGDENAALDLLPLALAERARSMVMLKVEPLWDPSRSRPEFAAIVSAVELLSTKHA